MKKLIAISVVFALVAGAAFAVDLAGSVVGTVNVIETTFDDGAVAKATGQFDGLRLQGAGEAGDGKFGGWIRFDPASLSGGLSEDEDAPGKYSADYSLSSGVSGFAWWKPIDQLKLTIGGNPDGIFAKEGLTCWMFYQSASDVGVTDHGDNAWAGGGVYGQGLKFRNAFFRGFGGNGLLLEIKPIDIIGINIAIPFIGGGKAEDVYKTLVAQVDLNFSFGNIAITYEGAGSYIQNGNVGWRGSDAGVLYGYFSLSAIENLNLDLGLGFQFNEENGTKNPFVIGLGFKYAAGAFAVKLRTVLSIPGEDYDPFKVLADLMPYYAVNDNLRIYFSAGLGILAPPKGGEAVVGWRINPYVEVGQEWGPKFYAGIKLDSDGNKRPDGKTTVNFSIPIALSVSF